MKRVALALVALLSMPCMTHAADEAAKTTTLYMPDGQLNSHMIRVYIDKDIGNIDRKQITLTLHTSHSWNHPDAKENLPFHPEAIDANHSWPLPIADTHVNPTGTMLLFKLDAYPIPKYKAAIRVLPELSWCGEGVTNKQNCRAIGEHEVYLADPIHAYLWSAATVIVLIALVVFMSRKAYGRAIYLLCEPSGKLSLSRTQMALWTIAIGGFVEAFGLTRLEIPDIPETLVALMGASLLTTGISYAHSDPTVTRGTNTPHWYDLICDSESNSMSLVRAQMFFWTIITLGIFVSKSMLEGVLWNVPTEMVGLMGMSQLAYLAPKIKQLQPQQPAAPQGQQPTIPPGK